jgi:hypothetical protein
MIASWIERKNERNLSFKRKYKFDLLYRSSRDGADSNSLVLVKILVKKPSSLKIYGGYDPGGLYIMRSKRH